MTRALYIVVITFGISTGAAIAQEQIELESIYVKGNKEFPQTLYVVPWKEIKNKDRNDQPLVLHSLFGDLFGPIYDDSNRIARRDNPITPSK